MAASDDRTEIWIQKGLRHSQPLPSSNFTLIVLCEVLDTQDIRNVYLVLLNIVVLSGQSSAFTF